MAQRPIQPHELIELAQDLAGISAGRGKPRTIYLRRAISTAYYAVFHKVTQHSVQHLLGDSWGSKHAAVARWITHTDLEKLAKAANGQGNAALSSALAPVDAAVQDLMQNFIDLQSNRHAADYNDDFDVTKAMTLTYVDMAGSSVVDADALYSDSEPSYMRCLGLALGGAGIAKKR
jgi:uncharacterized protein (UPF0332 family)